MRVWDLQGDGPARVIRGQVGAGSEGKIFAMALAPDGRTLAVGGWLSNDDNPIRLHDLASGRVLGLLRGHTNVVTALAFSPDGRRLVSGSADRTAMVWDLAQRRPLQRLAGHTDHIYAVAFTPDGKRVVTGSNDHDLRLWSAEDGRLIARLTGHTDKVRAVAVARDGSIASGSWDHTIRLWDGRSGRFLKTLADQGTQVGSLSFSPDGGRLLSGVGDGPDTDCHLWSVPSGRELRRYRGHDNVVIASAFAPDGRRVATGGGDNQEIHVWDPETGRLQRRLAGGGAATWAVGIAADGGRIAWGNTWTQNDPAHGYGPLEYQLPLTADGTPRLGAPTPLQDRSGLLRAVTTQGAWSLRHAPGGHYGRDDAVLEIRHNGQVQARIERGSTDGYRHRAYTFTPDGATLISGGAQGHLTAYDRSGHPLGAFVGHTGDIWALAVSGDGRLLVSGSDDQTVRLWSVASRELLLTLFQARPQDGRPADWVAWTPQGYYAASPDGDRMVGWQINRGPDQTPDYVGADQLRARLYRPDIVAEAVHLRSAAQAVAQAPQTPFQLAQLTQAQPPRFQVLSPGDGARLRTPQIELTLDVPPQPEALERVDIYVNGHLANRLRLGRVSLPQQAGGQRPSWPLALEPGENHLRVVAHNSMGETARELTVFLQAQAPERRGDLYLVSVGVSDYALADLKLRWAAADARDFHAALKAKAGGLYHAVHERLLASPTANAIRDALDLFKEAQPEDTLILFIAGHGGNEDDGYYFLAQDAAQSHWHWQSSSVVRWTEIQRALETAKGQRILFIDTCHSAAALNPRLIKDAADAQILVFSATDANTAAREIDRLQHGVFTYAILEGLAGKADFLHQKGITLKELDTYVSHRVTELTEGLQVPVIHTPGGFRDFVFALK